VVVRVQVDDGAELAAGGPAAQDLVLAAAEADALAGVPAPAHRAGALFAGVRPGAQAEVDILPGGPAAAGAVRATGGRPAGEVAVGAMAHDGAALVTLRTPAVDVSAHLLV